MVVLGKLNCLTWLSGSCHVECEDEEEPGPTERVLTSACSVGKAHMPRSAKTPLRCKQVSMSSPVDTQT